jgi:hypothetical protein
MLRKSIISFAFYILACFQARAEVSAMEFLRMIDGGRQDDRTVALLSINNLINGFGWYQAYLEQQELPTIYCPPRRLAITPDQAVDIMRRFVENKRESRNYPYGLAVLLAMQDAFPCGEGTR